MGRRISASEALEICHASRALCFTRDRSGAELILFAEQGLVLAWVEKTGSRAVL